MSCAACQDWLQEYLDGAAARDSAVEAHLRDCPDCAALFGSACRLRVALPALAAPRPRAGLSDKIVADYLGGLRRRRQRRGAALAAAALAAAVLVALGVRRLTPPTPDSDVPPPVARYETPPAPVSNRDRPVGPVPLREAVAEAGSAVAALTSRTADEAVVGTRRLLPAVVPPSLDDLSLTPEPAARPLREAGEGVTAGLEPVTTSARRAVGLFLRDLPPVDNEARPGL